jgi:hypothetical protein
MGQVLMGVWDLKGLHQEIQKWEILSLLSEISDGDRAVYLSRVETARKVYAEELARFEARSTIFEESDDAGI